MMQRHPKCSAHLQHAKSSESLFLRATYLANVTVKVTTKTLMSDTAAFAITVHDNKSSSTWRHLRSYSECRSFQSRVLKKLSRGHLCFAECPWLYTYVQRSLSAKQAASHLFRLSSNKITPRVLERQRQALSSLLIILQRVLLNPLNQRCKVLIQLVAPEVIMFITNRSDAGAADALNSPTRDQPLARQSSSSTTTIFNDLDEDVLAEEDANVTVATLDRVVAGQCVCCAMCALYKIRSDEQVFACWQSVSNSNRFMRLRTGAGAACVVLVKKSQSASQEKSAWESPTSSHPVVSSLKSTSASGKQESVKVHDGTPTLPFPGSPGTPRVNNDSFASKSRESSDCHVDPERLDISQLSSGVPSPYSSATTNKSPSLDNVRQLSHRSLSVLHSICRKFATRKHCII